MMMDEKVIARAEKVIEWNAEHALPDAIPGQPITGFGAMGDHTLWLASPKRVLRQVIRGGKLALETVPSGMTSRQMMELTRSTLLRMNDPADAFAAIVEYAVAVISASYRVDDDDLTELLAGDHWHQPMVRHLLGDERQIATLLGLSASRPERSEDSPMVPAVQPQPPAKRPARRRLRNWIFGR